MKTVWHARPVDNGCPPREPVSRSVARPVDNKNNDWPAPWSSQVLLEVFCCPPREHLKRYTRYWRLSALALMYRFKGSKAPGGIFGDPK